MINLPFCLQYTAIWLLHSNFDVPFKSFFLIINSGLEIFPYLNSFLTVQILYYLIISESKEKALKMQTFFFVFICN